MTKEQIINQYTPLDHPANKGKEFSVIRYEHLYKAMDEWAAIQNRVIIDALRDARITINDLNKRTGVNYKQLQKIDAVLASSAASPDEFAHASNKVLIDALKEELRKCELMVSITGNRLKDLYDVRNEERTERITETDLEIQEAKVLNTTYTTFASSFKKILGSYVDVAPQEVIEDEDDSGRYPGDGENESEAEFIERQLTKIKTLQKEVEELRQWRKEAMAVYDPIHEYAQHHPDIKLGTSMVSFVVDRAKMYDKMQGQVTGKSAGAALISKERQEQIEKHHRTVDHDVERNSMGELVMAAKAILASEDGQFPAGWDLTIIQKMCDKPYPERIVIAGAFLAAEYDRISADPHWEEGMKNESGEVGKQPLEKIEQLEGQVTGKSAGALEALREIINLPIPKTRTGEIRAYINKVVMIAGFALESGEAGKQPEQQPANAARIHELSLMVRTLSRVLVKKPCSPVEQKMVEEADEYLKKHFNPSDVLRAQSEVPEQQPADKKEGGNNDSE